MHHVYIKEPGKNISYTYIIYDLNGIILLFISFSNASLPIIYLDGSDFTKFEAFSCSDRTSYRTENSLVDAIPACRDDINCSMVSISHCSNVTSEVQLCSQSPELIPDLQSCTYRKKGTVITHYDLILTFVYYIILALANCNCNIFPNSFR